MAVERHRPAGDDALRMRTLLAAAALAIAALGFGAGGNAAPLSAQGDASAFGPIVLPPMRAGSTVTVDVPVTNTGSTAWTSPNVYLSYHWYTSAGALVVWDGLRTSVGAFEPGMSRSVSAQVATPATPRTYTLSFELVREGVGWFDTRVDVPARIDGDTYSALYQSGAGALAASGATVNIPVTLTNTGTATWSPAGANPVALAYHLYDSQGRLLVWDGARASIGSTMGPGQARTMTLAVRAPAAPGEVTIAVDLVREGVAWFSSMGSLPATVALRIPGAYLGIDMPQTAWAQAYVTGQIRVTNVTSTTWRAGGVNPVRLSYHAYAQDGALLVWDGERSALPFDVAPGASVAVTAAIRAPAVGGDDVIAWDLVEEGVAWLSSRGVATARSALHVRTLPSSLIGAEWYRIPTSERVVALTFDCGANADGAAPILSTLSQKQASATFFMCGSFAQTFPETARAIAARYPVGNHTVTHPDLRTLSDAAVRNEILDGARAIRAVTGIDPHPLFRFPYGASDARTIAIANADGYGSFRWTVDTLGWQGTSGGQTTQTVTARVLDALTPGAIVLMHVGSNPDDRSTLDADALAGLIDAIRARGYGFVTLPDRLS